MDYGDEWEEAWLVHVSSWRPVEEAEDYIAAFEFNEEEEYFLTDEEQEEDPYPPNVYIAAWAQFLEPDWKDEWDGEIKNPQPLVYVEVLQRGQDSNGEYFYSVRDFQTDKIYRDIPQIGLMFLDEPHTTDMFLGNSFRHEIGIPDHMFPDAWRNLRHTEIPNGVGDEL